MYALCVSAGKCLPPSSTESSARGSYYGNEEYDNYPVIYVSWGDAKSYCEWAGQRLPTEAEWEKAARGASGGTYPWGNDTPDSNEMNFGGDDEDTTEVGRYLGGASPYGALDMAGNVWEWVNDWYDEAYYGNSPSENPQGPDSGQYRVLRGGSWNGNSNDVRAANRYGFGPGYISSIIGFRCARSASQAPIATDTLSSLTQTLTATPAPTATLSIVSTQVSPIDGMVQVYVLAGSFQMGSDSGGPDLKPVHPVVLDAFWIDQTEVTNKMYALCVEAGKCSPPFDTKSYTRDNYYGNAQYDNYPVIYVSWDNAKAYCEWAGRRLPTEAEWEKAARGTDNRIYPWGNEQLAGNLLNFADSNADFDWSDKTVDDGYADTSPVGNYPDGASPYGTLDMAGNVWEWVNDWYGESYYSNSPSENPQGPSSGQERMLRGGSWYDFDDSVRAANRHGYVPGSIGDFVGFRCARSP